jgi:ethanolamine utilization protein EutN
MNLARVIGNVWATHKGPGLDGLRMLLIQPLTGEGDPFGKPLAAFDAVGCGEGELVFFVTQYEATLAFPERKLVPTDVAIIGIVDRIDENSAYVLGPNGGGDVGKAGS